MPVFVELCALMALLALPSGCGADDDYAVVTIQDPRGLATGAAALAVRENDAAVTTLSLGERSFPLSLALRWMRPDATPVSVRIDAEDGGGTVLATAALTFAPTARRQSIVAVLGSTCAHADGSPADGEECTLDATDGSAGVCSGGSCVVVTCGDHFVSADEQCDDGNTASGDGCDGACVVENGFTCTGSPSSCAPICGDHMVVGTEVCDRDVACRDCNEITEEPWYPAITGMGRANVWVALDTADNLHVGFVERAGGCLTSDCPVVYQLDAPNARSTVGIGQGALAVSRPVRGILFYIEGADAKQSLVARAVFGSTLNTTLLDGAASGGAVAVDGGGTIVAVTATSGALFDPTGVAIGAPFTLNPSPTGKEHDVAVAIADDGTFAVVYSDGESTDQLVFSAFDATGARSCTYSVTGATGSTANAIAVSSGDAGIRYVAAAATPVLNAMMLDGSCAVLGATAGVGTTADDIRIATASDGSMVIVWLNSGAIELKRFKSALTEHPAAVKLNPASSASKLSNVAMDANGNVAVAWLGEDGIVYAQRVTAANELRGSAW